MMNSDLALFRKQPEILVVDDVPENLQMLSGMLTAKGYKVRPVLSGRQALQLALTKAPDLILLDITMPVMNGYEVCAQLKASPALKDIPVIFISALSETEDKIKAFEAGGVDYVTKPFKMQEVQARVESHLRLRFLQRQVEEYNTHLNEMVQAQVKEISESQIATIFALAKLAESRDDQTGKHLERVQQKCCLLATWLRRNSPYGEKISQQFIKTLLLTSPLHDIGKVGIPDAILLKPGKLTEEEFQIVKNHTVIGAETLEAARRIYPRNGFINMGIGLSGLQISLAGRIMAVADVYDALRSNRVYKPAFSQEETSRIMFEGSGKHFDPVIIDAFRHLQDKFDELQAGFFEQICEMPED